MTAGAFVRKSKECTFLLKAVLSCDIIPYIVYTLYKNINKYKICISLLRCAYCKLGPQTLKKILQQTYMPLGIGFGGAAGPGQIG